MSLEDLYRDVILAHARQPHHYGRLDAAALHAHKHNPTCGDEIELYLHVDEAGIIQAVKFSGQGCAISQASASMMTDLIEGLHLDDAQRLLGLFSQMMTTDAEPPDVLGDATVLQGVSRFPTRVRCATLGWHALEDLLAQQRNR